MENREYPAGTIPRSYPHSFLQGGRSSSHEHGLQFGNCAECYRGTICDWNLMGTGICQFVGSGDDLWDYRSSTRKPLIHGQNQALSVPRQLIRSIFLPTMSEEAPKLHHALSYFLIASVFPWSITETRSNAHSRCLAFNCELNGTVI